MNISNRPIGLYDSGIGGISVLHEAMRQMPNEFYVYYGDHANVPYGTKTPQQIKSFVYPVLDFLMQKQIKALVVACNTITNVMIEEIRAYLPIPVVGMEPAIMPAARNSSGLIVALATPATVSMPKYHNLVLKSKMPERILSVPCPGLTELIEEDAPDDAVMQYLERTVPQGARNPAVVVLGCTHYVFRRKVIAQFFGSVPLQDGNAGTVRRLHDLLVGNSLVTTADVGQVVAYSSLPQKQEAILKRIADTDY